MRTAYKIVNSVQFISFFLLFWFSAATGSSNHFYAISFRYSLKMQRTNPFVLLGAACCLLHITYWFELCVLKFKWNYKKTRKSSTADCRLPDTMAFMWCYSKMETPWMYVYWREWRVCRTRCLLHKDHHRVHPFFTHFIYSIKKTRCRKLDLMWIWFWAELTWHKLTDFIISNKNRKMIAQRKCSANKSDVLFFSFSPVTERNVRPNMPPKPTSLSLS